MLAVTKANLGFGEHKARLYFIGQRWLLTSGLNGCFVVPVAVHWSMGTPLLGLSVQQKQASDGVLPTDLLTSTLACLFCSCKAEFTEL